MSRRKTTPSASLEGRSITLMRDTNLLFPELWLEVYVEGDAVEQAAFAEMFIRAKCTKADHPTNADLVVFTGGSDVNPVYYGEDKHPSTFFAPQRDVEDMKLYELCYNEGIPMFGVCRGAQFLHVMNGGKLFQDVDNHVGDHPIWDSRKKKMINRVSSVHHQACISNRENGMEVIADSFKSTTRWKNPHDKVIGNMADIEAFFYRDTCCLGVQGHPEYRGYFEFLKWTLEQIQDLIVENPDLELRDKCRRIKRDILEERTKWVQGKTKELN